MKKAKSLIYIESDITEKITIDTNITIYPIKQTDKQEIINKCGLTDDIYDIYTDILKSNYCFDVTNDDNAAPYFDMQILNQTLSLINKGSSRNILEIYLPSKELAINIFSSRTNDILGITKLNKDDIDKFKTILSKIRINRDSKLLLIINHYVNATSRAINDINNSFIELFTVLEMLYLNENDKNNINKKLKNRINKIINKDLSYYYTTRSKLVHTGKRKKSDKEDLSSSEFENAFLNVVEIVRLSISKYLDSPDLFSEKNLKIICNPQHNKETKSQLCSCDYCTTSS